MKCTAIKKILYTYMLKHHQQCSPLQFADPRLMAEQKGVEVEAAVVCLLKMRTLKTGMKRKGHLQEEHQNERGSPILKLMKLSTVEMPSDHLVAEF